MSNRIKIFITPLIIVLGIFLYVVLSMVRILDIHLIRLIIIFSVIVMGSFRFFKESWDKLLKRQLALDYIAIMAILLSVLTGEFIVASILALMVSTGSTLEAYAISQAKRSLTKLVDRIPSEVTLWKNSLPSQRMRIEKVNIGQEVFIRKGEVVGLDGVLCSKAALIDESSLTGEAYPQAKIKDDKIISGTVNLGDSFVYKITRNKPDSVYEKIIGLVKKAQSEKPPLVRLADRYSLGFVVITLSISLAVYIVSHFNLVRVLEVLVIATPCPLIIATPIALLGGVSLASKKNIIIKKLASLETLSKVNTIVFDKTGTLTLGKPKVTGFKILDVRQKADELLAIAQALERNSLHPLAKAIVEFAKDRKASIIGVHQITEILGKGIQGNVNNHIYSLSESNQADLMSTTLFLDTKPVAQFDFEDQVRQESKTILSKLKHLGLSLYIFTGDRKKVADKLVKDLNVDIKVKADCSPEDKLKGIEDLAKNHKIIAMVGDGINDAPALAKADVGMVFSGQEQTAASEAADIVFLGGNFKAVIEALFVAKKTINIALQSIIWGIGLSIVGMLVASFGVIPPIYGAFLQEGIDIAVILNAVRASFI